MCFGAQDQNLNALDGQPKTVEEVDEACCIASTRGSTDQSVHLKVLPCTKNHFEESSMMKELIIISSSKKKLKQLFRKGKYYFHAGLCYVI